MEQIGANWKLFSHDHQYPPDVAANGKPWLTWLMIGGRGAGKTRAGAEWVRAQALGVAPLATEKASRIALVGETEHDVREVMIEGVSGLLAVHRRGERPQWIPSRRRLEWTNGAVAQAFSADDPGEFARAAIRLRLVRRTREVALCRSRPSTCCSSGCGSATQPRQIDHHDAAADRAVQAADRRSGDRGDARGDARQRVQSGAGVSRNVMARYAGTRLGRQELDGEIIEERADALWSRALIETCRVRDAPPLRAHRGRGRSAGVVAQARRCLRHRCGGHRRATARSTCWRTTRVGAASPPAGRRRRSRCGAGSRPTRWSPRSTRAATWCEP